MREPPEPSDEDSSWIRVQRRSLPTGLTVIAHRAPCPGTAIDTAHQVGFRDEDDTSAGLAHLDAARCGHGRLCSSGRDSPRDGHRAATLLPSWPHRDRALGDVLATLFGDQHIGLATERLRSSLALSYDTRCMLRDVGPARVLMIAATVALEAERRALSELSAVGHDVADNRFRMRWSSVPVNGLPRHDDFDIPVKRASPPT